MFHTKVVEKTKTHILCYVTFKKNSAVYEICGKKGRAGQATDDNTEHALCMLAKSTDTHSEYVILIAFPQQWLRECASVLRYKNFACLFRFLI